MLDQDLPVYDPKRFPLGIRTLLAALSAQPDLTAAARAAAEALHRDDGKPGLQPPANASNEDKAAAEALRAWRQSQRQAKIKRRAEAIRHQHRRYLRDVPGYAEAYQAALDMGREALQDCAIRRAMVGWDEPVYQGGELVGYKRKRSDRLLLRSLETFYPETWGKHKIELSGRVQHGVTAMTDEELERIARGGNPGDGGGGTTAPEAPLSEDGDVLSPDGTAAPGTVP